MNHISQDQLLYIWSELYRAYYNDNGYGGIVAEIYTYTYLEHSGWVEQYKHDEDDKFAKKCAEEDLLRANKTLYDILKKFKETEKCKIYVDDKLFGKWLLKDINWHRRHIQVDRKDAEY